MDRVNVVVTCTKRKTRPAAADLQLRSVSAETPELRAERWIEALESARGEVVPALDLYSGDHWKVVRSLSAAGLRSGREVQLWVCSAGYGLISASTHLHPYSATFSDRHPDQVHRFSHLSRRESHRRWWAALTVWRGPDPSAPRTITGLASKAPDVPIVVVGSESYLEPLAADLQQAARKLTSLDRLLLLSGGMNRSPALEQNLIAFDARLTRALRGPLMSLNVRVAREMLEQGIDLTTSAVSRWVSEFGRELKPFEYPVRERTGDEEVKAYVRRELASNPGARWSPLHRKLREALQLACEQKRFRDLFFTVRAEAGAQEEHLE